MRVLGKDHGDKSERHEQNKHDGKTNQQSPLFSWHIKNLPLSKAKPILLVDLIG